MKHTRSSAEWDIRNAVVDFIRSNVPNARIVHELNVAGQGSNRADLAAIEPTRITLFEIKSAKDTLNRLAAQQAAFVRCSHEFVVVAHAKHFIFEETGSYRHPVKRLNADDYSWHALVWEWPEPEPYSGLGDFRWRLVRHNQWKNKRRSIEPKAAALLQLLWRDELFEACQLLGVPVPRRATIHDLIAEMCWCLNGEAIAKLVCSTLRRREFHESDAPIIDKITTANMVLSGGSA